jgi:nitroimidazol reductase NimA-like FMN-containing flavoprotein (pyridoxamine 5'-phosphate oxidase superfamily)
MKVIRDRLRTVELDEFLSRPLFAHLATAGELGPRESPVWFLWDESRVWVIGSRATDTFPERIEREPRCAIGIVDFDRLTGLVQHVGLRGRASIEAFDAQRAGRLLARYLGPNEPGWDARFLATLEDPDAKQAVLVRFTPETIVARDVSYAPSPLRT